MTRNRERTRTRPCLENLEGRRLLTIDFSLSASLGTGLNPQGVLLADFNGDTKLDLAVAVTGSNWVGVRLGNGDGTFGEPSTFVAGGGPVRLASGDLNHDGKTDLVVANASSDNASVLLGNGDGTFQTAVQYAAGDRPKSITLDDFNGDGDLDMVVGNQGNDIDVFLGNGDGSFAAKSVIPYQDQVDGVVGADINKDGKLDLLATGYFSFNAFLGNGDGTFGPRTSYTTHGGAGYAIGVGDLNGDGNLDAVESSSANYFVATYLGDGTGAFNGPLTSTISNVGWNPYDVALSDFDNDGNLDVLVGAGRATILPGRGDGTFDDPVDFAIDNHAFFVAVGDLNGDGLPDIVTSNEPRGDLSVLINNSNKPPIVGVGVAGAHVAEGNVGTTLAPVTVQLSAPSTEEIDVAYTTSGGTAAPGVDYTPVSGILRFAPGVTSRTINVPTIGNLTVDGTRTIGITLSSPTGPATITNASAVLTIYDNEQPSTFDFKAPQVVVDEAAGVATVTVVRNDSRSDGVTVHYSTLDGSAVAGVDYTPTSGTLRFAPGESALTFQVPILDNPSADGDRTISLVLSTPTGGTLGTQSVASIRIVGDTSTPPVVTPPVVTPPVVTPPVVTPPVVTPPLVTVQSVTIATKHGAIASINVGFSDAVDARSAGSRLNYRMVWAGRDGKFGTRDDRFLPIRRAIYHAASHTVTITPRRGLGMLTPRMLTVTASVSDTHGRAIDGDQNGLPGGDYHATLSRCWTARTVRTARLARQK